ncbi:formate dehydrogenase [Aquincola sp. S2]|uniref:Formate dehydrogenase n=1 Tax=Pseudaquabacterium terrae TaxID=2732868 RepID=A0ABX2EQ62_9BURK|nr:formate dehydrogenase [Aquabacterium terrae]
MKRRGLLAGAGAAGAAALAVTALPEATPEVAAAAAAVPKALDTSAGYRLSAHVLRYYETTRS